MSTGSLFNMTGATATAAVHEDPPLVSNSTPRPLPKEAGNPEEGAKYRALALHEYTSRAILARLREAMRILYMKRRNHQGAEAFVTADDARVVLEADPDVPPARDLSRNFMGSLFRSSREWESTGKYVKSKTAGSHANPVMCWRWVGARLRDERRRG